MISRHSVTVLLTAILLASPALGETLPATAALEVPADLRVGDSFFLIYDGHLNPGAYVLQYFEIDPNGKGRLACTDYQTSDQAPVSTGPMEPSCGSSLILNTCSFVPTMAGTYKYITQIRTFYGSKGYEVKGDKVCLTPPFTSEISNSTAVEIKVSPAVAGSAPRLYNGIPTATIPVTLSPAPTGESFTMPKSGARARAGVWTLGAVMGSAVVGLVSLL